MRLLACLAFFVTGAAFAQSVIVPDAGYPSVPAHAANAEGFVPAGWRIESRTEGDLDGDGRPDLVLVMRENNPRNVVTHDGMGENPFDTNPRMLVVAFAREHGYELALENHTLIPRRDDPVVDDMLDQTGGVSVRRGTLRVALQFFASAGSWEMSSTTYTFRWQQQKFALIGYDHDSSMRNSGETHAVSINYISGKVKRSAGNFQEDGETVSWEVLPSSKRWNIEDIGDGMTFDPLSDRK